MKENRRMLDEDRNAYRLLAALFEPIVSEELRMRKVEEKKDYVISVFLTEKTGIIDRGFRRKGSLMHNGIRNWCNLRQFCDQGKCLDRWETHHAPEEKDTYMLHL